MKTHRCTKELYQAFVQASCVRYSGLALSQVSPLELSHDAVSRWLREKDLRPRDVWQKAKEHIDFEEPSVLVVDDTVINKQYSKKMGLVKVQYSGNNHGLVAGIGLVNMLWQGLESQKSIPIDYRIYDLATDGKNKNTHFQDMLSLAKKRGMNPEAIVMDTWYSGLKNLKVIRNHGWHWVCPLRKNRCVNKGLSLQNVEIPEEGVEVHLRAYGWIKVFKLVSQNGGIEYVATSKRDSSRAYVEKIMQSRWSIEVYHRELKQTCGLKRCQARQSRSQRNHINMSIMTWFSRYKRRIQEEIRFYEQNWEVAKGMITLAMQNILQLT